MIEGYLFRISISNVILKQNLVKQGGRYEIIMVWDMVAVMEMIEEVRQDIFWR